jgi:hypothetical protein
MSSRPLDLYSERYAASGSMGSNFKRLLGTPANDRLETVLREAVQNSIDASLDRNEVRIRIRYRSLAARQVLLLADTVFAHTPWIGSDPGGLLATLGRTRLPVLEISDFGTTGLDGPTRADRFPDANTRTNFVDFVCNIGTPRDRTGGGGTYGFGKSAYYAASTCSTLLIDTVVRDGAGFERRFIACHAGDSFDRKVSGEMQRHTGRQWWGREGMNGGFVDPATGDEAQRLSEELGMSPRSRGDTGTTVVLLDPVLGDMGPRDLGMRIAGILLSNFWPRMTRDTPRSRRIRFELEVDGQEVGVPDPENCPPLNIFCEALSCARTGVATPGVRLHTVECQRPRKVLGTLAYKSDLKATRVQVHGDLFQGIRRSHHIALMRPVELVVKYLEGSEVQDERLEWAGVFIASEEEAVERAFASAEPPAHDDWVPASIQDKSQRTFVNVALRRLREHALSPFDQLAGGGSQIDRLEPLARVAGALGRVLDHTAGGGAGPIPGGQGGSPKSGRKRGSSASTPRFSHLLMDEVGVVAVFVTQVEFPAGTPGSVLSATASVVLEGSTQNDGDDIESAPVVIGMRRAGDSTIDFGPRYLVTSAGEIEIHVRMSGEYAATVGVELERVPD